MFLDKIWVFWPGIVAAGAPAELVEGLQVLRLCSRHTRLCNTLLLRLYKVPVPCITNRSLFLQRSKGYGQKKCEKRNDHANK